MKEENENYIQQQHTKTSNNNNIPLREIHSGLIERKPKQTALKLLFIV